MANTKITSRVIANDAITSDLIADDVALGGNPTTSTQTAGNSTTRIATTAFVSTAVANIVDSAPATLDTLGEIATALNNDAALNTTLTNSIATKLPLAGGTMTGHLILGDSVKAQFGTSSDLSTYHSGSHSYIENNTGNLVLLNNADDKDIILQSDDGSGGATSYITVDGSAALTQFDKHTKHTDNIKAYFGNSSDLQIYHDGSHSTIKEDGAGDLRIDGDSVYIRESDGTNQISAASGTATLYKDGTARLATSSSGVTVTGTLTASGITVDELTIDADTITATDDFIIDATTNIFLDADGGEIVLRDGGSNFGYFHQDSDNFEILSTRSDGDIIIKGNDGGSTIAALTLDMSDAGTATFNHDIKLGDNGQIILGAGSDFSMYHDGSNTCMNESGTGGLRISSSAVRMDLNSDTDYSSTGEPAGILTLYNSNGSDGGGVNNYSSLEFNTGDGATSQGFINYIRTADNQGRFAFSQRTGSSSYAEALTILNDGKVGIGTASPAEALEVYATEASGGVEILLTNVGDGGSNTVPYTAIRSRLNSIRNGGEIRFGRDSSYGSAALADSNIQFYTALNDTNREAMRIQSDGIVVISSGAETFVPTIKHGGATGDLAKLRVINRSGQSSNKGGLIELGGVTDDGVSRSDVFGAIAGLKNNATSANREGYLQFSTNDGDSLDEYMRLTSGGVLCVGDTTTYSGGHDAVSRMQLTGGGSVLAIRQSQVTDGSHRVVAVFTDNGGTYRGRITINNSSCSFTAASDYRLKENIEPLPNGLDRLKQLKPVKFKWKEHDYTSEGFIAHEVQEIYPEAVVGEKDDEVMQSMDYGKITPLLVKAIQEQQTIIDDLKARIETLEG